MSNRFTDRILEHLSHDRYVPSRAEAIARDMRMDQEDRAEFDEAIRQLADDGHIVIGKDGLVRLPPFGDELVGKFRLNAKGFGFIIPDRPYRDGDLFVPAGDTRDAISGDRVRAQVIRRIGREKQDGRSPFVGRIVEVIERGQANFVGTLVHERGRWLVKPDGRSLFEQVLIRDPHSKTPAGARPGDKVVFELLRYPEGAFAAEGVITKVLGEAGRPDVETQAVIAAHGLRTDFPEHVVEQARQSNRHFEAMAIGPWPDREDLTGELIFTIDPPDAKDFDDAISISHNPTVDRWVLGVHIADVAEFVTQGTALDEEAKARGNSVYLPRLVLPMLPEILSNGVCSLQEGVPRFCKSAFITLDGKGKVLSTRLSATVIKSSKRMTYLEAQALIDGDPEKARTHARTDTPPSEQLIKALKMSDSLARIIQRRRRADGMIVLNLPEVELVFDEQGHVIDAHPQDDSFTHKLIEMFMVEANEAVARTFSDCNVPLIRRIHPEPVHGDIEELRMYARAAQEGIPEHPTRHDLQRLLEATANTPAAKAIHFAVLRTLSKATYSPALIGHFALASDHYAHFTSPIRRYPDLTVHRAIAAYLDLTDNGANAPAGKARRALGDKLMRDDRILDEGQLFILGRHCSDTERAAEDAERQLTSFLVMQFLLEHHLGSEFPGVVTGVTHGGVFVSIEPFLAEGMVRVSDLPQGEGKADRWNVNDRTGRLTSPRSGVSVGVGDIVTVRIVKINLAARQMDLIITKMPERTGAGDGKREGKGEPGGRPRSRGERKASPEKAHASGGKHRTEESPRPRPSKATPKGARRGGGKKRPRGRSR